MPLVRVPILPTRERIQDTKKYSVGGMQKFYKTNGVGIAPKKQATRTPISDSDVTVKLNPNKVQKFLSHINVLPDKKGNVHKCKTSRSFEGHVYENVEVKNSDAKLNKALETFDKILSEFTTVPQPVFVPPKLQKAKTCIIIESRCILKKSEVYDPLNKRVAENQKKTQHPPLAKTKSLWNLNDMEEMHQNSKIPIFTNNQNDHHTNKYNTYKITAKDAPIPLESADIHKLDVKSRILRKTFSNPPSNPVPVIPKSIKKIERRTSDPNKKTKTTRPTNQPKQTLIKSKTSDQIEIPKHKMQKSRSIWEMSKSTMQNKPLSRTKSTASLTGSSSKIPVVRAPNTPLKKLTKPVLPTPDNLSPLDQSKDSEVNKNQHKKIETEMNEINKVRAKIQQKKLANPITIVENRIKRSEPVLPDVPFSPVKSIISKMEMHAVEGHAEPYQNKFITLPKKPARKIDLKNDRKLSVSSGKSFASSDEKIYEGHSDYSDDSGHASNESESVIENALPIFGNTAITTTTTIKTSISNRKANSDGVKKPDLISDLTKSDKVNTVVPVPAERRSTFKTLDSEVLLRAGALSSLEKARDERLRARITRLQAFCRGTLARRALARRRVQEVAVRCLQRNVRAFLAVRDWPWWRLLVRITPLLEVHRTEDQLRAKTEELDAIRSRVEKLELERSALKHENDKLENKLSEMTAELAVEQASGSLASERLGAETAERLRLEKDLQSAKVTNASLQQTSERLETELMYARADTNGSVASETGEGGAGSDSEGSGDGGRYKRRLQVALRELEAARRQLRQQHEDDLEQLVTLKKQLEKKVADAYEEAEEQRQVAAQWKRKAQKAASDANDVRLLLDEQGAKATLFERRQRKFDAECQQLREESRRERQTRERAQRDYEQLLAEKCALDQTLADIRLESDMKEEKLNNIQRELDDLTFGGKTEEEVGALKKIKHDLENKCHDQEEELDDLAGQVQLLESHKVRLEMSLEQQRKATRLEASQRDEELEEVRAQSAKKIKALESQLEIEHNERTLVLRERHELERRLAALEESARADAAEREQREQRARRDLRRYKALARDAQVVLERREQDSGAKAQLRQLRDKLDDAEVALRAAQKARQVAESELAESLSVSEEAARGRREAESRSTQAQREAASARAQLEEAEEEAADVMKKYRACVATLSEEQRAAKEAAARAASAEEEARIARDRAADLASRLASLDNAANVGQAAQQDRLELRTKELEASLELEQTARARLEAQAARAREAASAGAQALGAAQQRENTTAEDLRRAMRTVRELREELASAGARCDEAVRARSEAETRLEEERTNAASARADLRATNQRLLLLQQAIADDISPDNGSDSENDSCSSEESIETFLANHKLSPIPNHGSTTPKSGDGRQSRSSVTSTKQLSPSKDSFA